MHLGTTERLVVGLLAGRHLHQRRAAEEHLGLLLDHHGVVAHPGHVGAAGGGVAEDDRDRRHLGGRRAGDVAEQLAAGDEDLLLRRQISPAGLDQGDGRQPVLLGDLRGAEDLLHRPRVRRATLHRRVVRGDHALDALDDADAGDHAGADGEVRAPAGQRRQLEERAAGVDEQLDPLARHQLAAGVVALDVLLTAAGHRDRVLCLEVGDLGEHRLAARTTGSVKMRRLSGVWAARCDASAVVGSWRVPQQSGGQVGEHFGRSSSDAEDPGVAVVPLHLGPVHVAGAAVQLHGLVDDVGARLDRGLLGQARLGDDVLPVRRAARRRGGCRRARSRPAGASRRACAARPGGRSAACRRSPARGSTPPSGPASGRRCRRRVRRARSARPRTARRSGRSPSSPRRRGWPPAPARRRRRAPRCPSSASPSWPCRGRR